MRHLFVVNPAAGGKDRTAALREKIRPAAEKAGLDYEIYRTKAPMDACEKVRAAAAEGGALRVYACGGDGTLNECANGAAGLENVELTHYPVGTGNDFVKTFGPDAALFSDLKALIAGEARPIDLIACNDRYGISICSVGIDARIGTDVHKYSHIPLIGGATGYVISLAVNMFKGINQELEVTVDGRRYAGEKALVCACNGRYYGGGFCPIPEAEPDDGKMDILIVEAVSRLGFLRMVGRYAKGRYKELSVVKRETGQRMELSAPMTLTVNIDGEILRTKQVALKMAPGALRFVFPRGAAFLKERKKEIAENQ